MSNVTPSRSADDLVTFTIHFSGSGVSIDENYPWGLSENHKTIALGTAIRKLMDLYNERLSARNTP